MVKYVLIAIAVMAVISWVVVKFSRNSLYFVVLLVLVSGVAVFLWLGSPSALF